MLRVAFRRTLEGLDRELSGHIVDNIVEKSEGTVCLWFTGDIGMSQHYI